MTENIFHFHGMSPEIREVLRATLPTPMLHQYIGTLIGELKERQMNFPVVGVDPIKYHAQCLELTIERKVLEDFIHWLSVLSSGTEKADNDGS